MASEITPITMPKFGLAMTEGKVAGWMIAPGKPVKAGDELVDIETSKITNSFEARHQVSCAVRLHPMGKLCRSAR